MTIIDRMPKIGEYVDFSNGKIEIMTQEEAYHDYGCTDDEDKKKLDLDSKVICVHEGGRFEKKGKSYCEVIVFAERYRYIGYMEEIEEYD